MNKASQAEGVSKITKWLKLVTYICATILLIANNNLDSLTFLIPLAVIVIFISYFRDYYLVANQKPLRYTLWTIAFEIILIITIAYLDKSDISILFYFVCISSTVIIHPLRYFIPLPVVYIGSSIAIQILRNGTGSLKAYFTNLLFSYVVSTIFVVAMSYLVKLQIREKDKLAHMNAELEQAYKKLIENSAIAQKLTIEQERTRMAREIHDTLAHTLTTLIVQLEACKKLASMDPSRLQDELEKAQELSRSGFNDVKRSIKALRPQAMEDKPFVDSILTIINDTMENTKVHITLNNNLTPDIRLSTQIEVVIFRVIQESITNSIRHGKASEIGISMDLRENILYLIISDNGAGNPNNIKKGYGLKGITERIKKLNGNVEFSSSHGKGFKTNIKIPFVAA